MCACVSNTIYLQVHKEHTEVRERSGEGLLGLSSIVKLGQKVGGSWRLGLVEVTHDVCFLFPHVNGLLQLHLPLRKHSYCQ